MCMELDRQAKARFLLNVKVPVWKFVRYHKKTDLGFYEVLETPHQCKKIELGKYLVPTGNLAGPGQEVYNSGCIHAYYDKNQALNSGWMTNSNVILLELTSNMADVIEIGSRGEIVLSRLWIPESIQNHVVAQSIWSW